MGSFKPSGVTRTSFWCHQLVNLKAAKLVVYTVAVHSGSSSRGETRHRRPIQILAIFSSHPNQGPLRACEHFAGTWCVGVNGPNGTVLLPKFTHRNPVSTGCRSARVGRAHPTSASRNVRCKRVRRDGKARPWLVPLWQSLSLPSEVWKDLPARLFPIVLYCAARTSYGQRRRIFSPPLHAPTANHHSSHRRASYRFKATVHSGWLVLHSTCSNKIVAVQTSIPYTTASLRHACAMHVIA